MGTPPEARGEGSSGVASRGVPESKERRGGFKARFQVLKVGFRVLGLVSRLVSYLRKMFQEYLPFPWRHQQATSGKFEGLVLKGVGRIVQGTGMREEL